MHDRIRIEHRHAFFGEHCADRRLAHADRSGEAENDHRMRSLRSSASCSRGAGAPKKSSKAGAACPMSMERPPTVWGPIRSEERCVGKEWGCTVRSRWAAYL